MNPDNTQTKCLHQWDQWSCSTLGDLLLRGGNIAKKKLFGVLASTRRFPANRMKNHMILYVQYRFCSYLTAADF